MKKNAKIGIGLAVISVVSLAAVNPVFADVRPGYIETTGTVVSAYSVNKVEEKADEPKVDEIKIGSGIDETSIDSPDFEKSPNFCKLKFDAKSLEKLCPEHLVNMKQHLCLKWANQKLLHYSRLTDL